MMGKNTVTSDMKMAEVIHMNYLLLPVINRFGIKLGFGDKTVEKVCRDHGLNLSFFLDIVNTYHDPSYFPRDKMRGYPATLIIDYLLQSHEYYNRTMLPEAEGMIEKLVSTCSGHCEDLRLIEDFYRKYKEELQNHLSGEEIHFFPYVRALVEGKTGGKDLETLRREYNFSYQAHADEHESVIAKLVDLKNILIKYLPPDYDVEVCNNLLYWLFIFEDDLKDHERLEDVILLPVLENIEQQFRNQQ